MRPKKAVVLLSGGIDSTCVLFWALHKGYICKILIFDYGQRHRREIEVAKKIARKTNCSYRVVKFSLPWKGSSLIDRKTELPSFKTRDIPSSYVPARNIIFLSFALSYAETIGAGTIFIGANAIDFSGYPDCRPQFYRAFREVILRGTKAGLKKKRIEIKTPLIHKTKGEIIKLAFSLGVPLHLTWSCYRGLKRPCLRCPSCLIRKRGFQEAGLKDPLL